MAKRKTEARSVEPSAHQYLDNQRRPETVEDEETTTIDELKPEPTYAPDPAERQHVVTFTLPYSVLVALLDPEHPDASVFGAEYYGLVNAGELSPIGEKVVAGFDRTAVGHKMATAWRNAHNAALGPSKAERP